MPQHGRQGARALARELTALDWAPGALLTPRRPPSQCLIWSRLAGFSRTTALSQRTSPWALCWRSPWKTTCATPADGEGALPGAAKEGQGRAGTLHGWPPLHRSDCWTVRGAGEGRRSFLHQPRTACPVRREMLRRAPAFLFSCTLEASGQVHGMAFCGNPAIAEHSSRPSSLPLIEPSPSPSCPRHRRPLLFDLALFSPLI